MTAVADAVAQCLVVTERSVVPSYAEELVRGRHVRPVGHTDSLTVAVDLVRTRRPDVVVADVVTADRLAHLLTAVRPMAPARVVVVCGLPAEVALITAMAAGARAFLGKPVDVELLRDSIRWVAAGHLVVDPMSTRWLVELALHGHRARPDSGLTLRQSQVVALVRNGLTNREIGEVLGLSADTVKTHLRHAMKHLRAHDRRTAGALADQLRAGDQ